VPWSLVRGRLRVFLLSLGLFGVCGLARAATPEGLQLELTPYVWAAGIDGEITAQGQTVNFDYSFTDLVSKVDVGFMGLAIASYDRFVVYVDYDYIGLENDATATAGVILPPGTEVQADIDTTIATYAAGYRFDLFGKGTIDVMLGARTLSLDETLKISNVKLDNKSSLTDTIIVLRPSLQLSERWRFNPTLSYGVSGDSDTTYELAPQVQFDFSKSFAMRFGYRSLYYEEGSADKVDIDMSGLFVGVGWILSGR
jgi:hypothetical protein